MTNQTPPAGNPQPKPGSLLEPEDRGISDFILPGILGVAGAALIYKSFSKKEKKGSAKSAPTASDNEIKFSKGFSTYTVGKDWESMTLEPYLAEQAEEGNLITEDYADDTLIGSTGMIEPMLNDTRKKVVAAFRATHKVSTSEGESLISKLPPEKSGVKRFNEWLDAQVREFQEEY